MKVAPSSAAATGALSFRAKARPARPISTSRGAALITALLIAALAAAIAADLLWQQQVWLQQQTLSTDQTQARTLALAGIDWARSILADDARTSSIDSLAENWAIRLPTTPLENGEISGYIVDQQGLYNLNNLVQNGRAVSLEIQKFHDLLGRLGLPSALADATLDWVDPDQKVTSPGGAEDAYYRSLSPPGWPPNHALLRVADLSQVRGYTPQALARLAPFVTALPMPTPVNVNTAPAEVLSAVVSNLPLERARLLTAPLRSFLSINQFRTALPNGALVGDTDVDVRSQFFMVSVSTRIGSARASARALVQRGGDLWPKIVWQVVE